MDTQGTPAKTFSRTWVYFLIGAVVIVGIVLIIIKQTGSQQSGRAELPRFSGPGGAPAGRGTPPTCTDSDGGSIAEVRGTTSTTSGASRNDTCVDPTRVIEYSCVGNRIASRGLSCAQGYQCENGACVALPAPPVPISCTDSDGGQDSSVRGVTTITHSNGSLVNNEDTCAPNLDAVREHFCDSAETGDATLIPCQYGCGNGVCLPALPDLIIENLTIGQWSQYGQLNYTMTVKNNGAGLLAVRPDPDLVYISNILIDENGNRVASFTSETNLMSCAPNTCVSFATLAPGASVSMYGVSSFPIQTAIDGNARGIRVKVDSRNTYPESNEENNTADIAIPPDFFSWTPPEGTPEQVKQNVTGGSGAGADDSSSGGSSGYQGSPPP